MSPSPSAEPATKPDRRKHIRRKPRQLIYIDVGQNNGGFVLDVSEGGVCFQGMQSLQEGETVKVRFKLPGTNISIRAEGQFVRAGNSKKDGAIRFLNLPAEVQMQLREWIALSEAPAASPSGEADVLRSLGAKPPVNSGPVRFNSVLAQALAKGRDGARRPPRVEEAPVQHNEPRRLNSEPKVVASVAGQVGSKGHYETLNDEQLKIIREAAVAGATRMGRHSDGSRGSQFTAGLVVGCVVLTTIGGALIATGRLHLNKSAFTQSTSVAAVETQQVPPQAANASPSPVEPAAGPAPQVPATADQTPAPADFAPAATAPSEKTLPPRRSSNATTPATTRGGAGRSANYEPATKPPLSPPNFEAHPQPESVPAKPAQDPAFTSSTRSLPPEAAAETYAPPPQSAPSGAAAASAQASAPAPVAPTSAPVPAMPPPAPPAARVAAVPAKSPAFPSGSGQNSPKVTATSISKPADEVETDLFPGTVPEVKPSRQPRSVTVSQSAPPVFSAPDASAAPTSNVEPAKLVLYTEPVYPSDARAQNVQGTVDVLATIGKDGVPRDLRVETGDPKLATAAIAAISKWRYRPAILNGQFEESFITITLKFAL